MNIFNLPLEEAEKEIDKMIKSVPKEQLIQDLKECGLMNKQDKKEIMNLIKYKKMLGGRRMTVGDLIKRLEKIDKDKMCIWKESVEDEGWANLGMKEEDYYVYFIADMKPLFDN